MHSTRYCKFHYFEGESEHWGLLDRKSFAMKGSKPHFTPDTPFTPIHLKLELNFDWDEERVWGVTTHQLAAKGHDLREVRLDAMHLEVSRVLLGGKTAEFENTGENLSVPLKKPLNPGQRVEIAVHHSVAKPQAGIYFTKPDKHYPDRFKTVWTQGQDEDSRYYFPCLDKPNFKQTTEVVLHLPPGMFGLSNGKLINRKSGPRESLYHYKLDIPYSTYLLTIVGGEFSEARDKWEDIDIRWYVQKGREKEGANSFKDTARIMAFLSEYTGYRYPYKSYTQVAVPEFVFGGMENFTATTQTDLTLHDDRAHLDMDSNGLVAHEAAHMWFGDLVTAKNWSHAWLHESFATFFDALYTRHSKGEDEFRYQVLEDAETYFAEDAKYRRPIVTHIYKEPIDLFDAHLYPGGGVRLRHLISIAGEKLFREAVRVYLKRHEFGLVETVDFVRCLEEVAGRNFDEWLDQWIYRGGYPTLEISFKWEDKFHLAVVEIKQTQKADKKDEELLFKLPLKIAFYNSRSSEVFPLEINGKEEKFCFRLKSKPLFLRLDPDYECPCKKTKLEMSRPMLREQLKRDPDPIGRIEASAELAVKPSTGDVKFLGDCLRKEKFWGVAERIASALGKIGGDLARDLLIKGLRISHPKARLGVVKALGGFVHDEKAAAALRKVAHGDPSYRVEAGALSALGKIRDKKSREFLERSLGRPSHNDMAQSAIYNALGELEDDKSWDCLLRGAEYGAARNSRGAAMRALARLARRYPARKGEAIEHLARFAKETRGTPAAVFRGKLGAIQALQNLEDLDAIPALRYLAANESDGRLQRRAEEAIAALFDAAKKPEELKKMREELDDVARENKSLRDRFDTLEKKEKAKDGGKPNKKTHK
ncbi:MAG: M1 family metallopeptidase [Nitrospinae bacterium]|nr:M1 family metallopeptidase [Nitrospinota bacterium]